MSASVLFAGPSISLVSRAEARERVVLAGLPAILGLLALGCGATSLAEPATTVASSPRVGEPPAPTRDTASASEGPIPASAPAPDLTVDCTEQLTIAEILDEPTLLSSGGLRIRARSLVLEFPDSEGVLYCHAARLPEGSHLVLIMDDESWRVGAWNGSSLTVLREDDASDEGEAEAELPTVIIPGQTVTAVRPMHYCPVDPSRPCNAAGDYTTLAALPWTDPVGPRSGWDFTEVALTVSSAVASRDTLAADACGLTVSLRGETGCRATTLDDVLACMAESRFGPEDLDPDDSEGAAFVRAQQAVELAFSDGTHEVRVPAYDVTHVSCASGVVVLDERGDPYGTRRVFAAIDLRARHIAGAHRLSVVHHEEWSAQCANVVEGDVRFIPVVEGGSLLGGVLPGAVRFDLSRGDVGEPVFARPPSTDRPDDETEEEDAPAPVAYRMTRAGLVPIFPAAPARRSTECPLTVTDRDGQTNVRPTPSTEGAPVATIPSGTVVRIVEQRGRWYRVETPHAGWVWSGSLTRRCAP